MNKNILLVMKWLDSTESVTAEELTDNRKSAAKAFKSAYLKDGGSPTTDLALFASQSADNGGKNLASLYVDGYFKHTGKREQEYLDNIAKEV